MFDNVVTAVGSPNIALIKYWGKRDEKLILPNNSSVSITLGGKLYTKTSVMLSKRLKKDAFYINGEMQNLADKELKERFYVINHLRKLAGTKEKILVVSKNSFPTSGGLASSASGIATLVFATSKALNLNLSNKELSIIARQGSGSACRSILGGFVKWNAGKRNDGKDSFAEQIAPGSYWPEIIDIIAIVSEKKKKISSRAGMRQTSENGILYESRLKYLDNAINEIVAAIKHKNFEKLAEITMRDSNNMHATMLDTWPPIFYMNDVSREIIYKIHELNDNQGKMIAAYTLDAGPNVHIITLKKYRQKVIGILREEVEGIKSFIESDIGHGPKIVKGSIIEKRMLPK